MCLPYMSPARLVSPVRAGSPSVILIEKPQHLAQSLVFSRFVEKVGKAKMGKEHFRIQPALPDG